MFTEKKRWIYLKDWPFFAEKWTLLLCFNLHQPEFGLLTCTAAVKLSWSEVFAPQTHKETGAGGDDDIWGHGDVPPGDSLFWG